MTALTTILVLLVVSLLVVDAEKSFAAPMAVSIPDPQDTTMSGTMLPPLLGERVGARPEGLRASVYSNPTADCVILLHGLARTSLSMKGIEWYLKRRCYRVLNARYPTYGLSVEQISDTYLAPLLESDIPRSSAKIHFVTHSQGGIVLRQYLSNHDLPSLGRVVMLAPPNHGSEIVDRLQTSRVARPFLGPGYRQLGAGADSLPNRLGPVQFDCGIIAGDFSLNPFLSSMLTGPNDGKVTVASAQLDGMHDFLVLHYSHTWLMWRKNTLRQIQSFLKSGRFDRRLSRPPLGS
jgi:triacylglycerol lipase